MDSPPRIVLDISGAGRSTTAASLPVNSGGVKAVRTSQYKTDVVRVVIDLEGALPTYRLSRVAAGFLLLFPRDLPDSPPVIEVVRPKAAVSSPPAAAVAAPAKPAAESRPAADSAIKRINEVEDVANVAVLLASDIGAGITGSLISIDGGTSPY